MNCGSTERVTRLLPASATDKLPPAINSLNTTPPIPSPSPTSASSPPPSLSTIALMRTIWRSVASLCICISLSLCLSANLYLYLSVSVSLVYSATSRKLSPTADRPAGRRESGAKGRNLDQQGEQG